MATGKINMVQIMQAHLESQVKETITEELVKKQLAEYEKDLRGLIKELFEGVVFDQMEEFRNITDQRDEFNLWIKWNDERKNLIKGS